MTSEQKIWYFKVTFSEELFHSLWCRLFADYEKTVLVNFGRMGSFPLLFFSLHSKFHCMDLGETYFLLQTNCLTQKREGGGGGGGLEAQAQRLRIKSIRPKIVLHTTFEPRSLFGTLKQKGKCDLFPLHHFNHAACKMLIYYYSLK